ncbi:MAG: regulatory protein RecX [Desulfobacteraceae bacterium]
MNKACLNKAFRILARRDHSRAELTRKLAEHGYDGQSIQSVINECQRLGYLDDKRFAYTYCEQLLRKGYGPIVIQQKLYAKGLPAGIIKECVASHCDESVQLDVCRRVLAKKTKNFSDEITLLNARAKHQRFLLGRGFSSQIACQIIEEAIGREEE